MATPGDSRNTRSRSRRSEAEANNGSNNPTPTSVQNSRLRGVNRAQSSPLSPAEESVERVTSVPSNNANSGSRSLSGRYARGPTDSPGTHDGLRTRRRRPEGASRARRQMFTDASEEPERRERPERADEAHGQTGEGQGSQDEVADARNPTPSPNVISSQTLNVQRVSGTPRRTPVSSPFSGLSPYRPSPHSRGEIRSGSSGRRVLQRISSTPNRGQPRGGPANATTPRSEARVTTPDPSSTTPRGTPSASLSDAPSEPIQTFVWGTNVNIEDCSARFRRFLENFEDDDSSLRTPRNDDIGAPAMYMRKIREVVEKEFISLNVDCANLKKFDAELYNVLIHYPEEVIPLSDLVATELATNVAKSMYGLRTPGATPTTPNDDPLNGRRLQVRPFNLTKVKSLRDLDPVDIDQMVCVRGMITRSSMVSPDLKQAYYECSICGASEVTFIDNGTVVEPQQCNNPGNPHKNTMHLVHNRCTFTDKQIVRMQETPDGMPEGQTPHTVTLFVYDELVDVMKPGDRVEITAIFRASADRENPRTRSLRSLYHTYLDVLHVRKAEGNRFITEQFSAEKSSQKQDDVTTFFESDRTEQEMEEEEITLQQLGRKPAIYEQLVKSLAPSIFGLEDVKKGLLCQLFGGSNKRAKSATPGTADPVSQGDTENESIATRGDINILMCGDPGTSKSQLLSYVHKIAPRGIYTSGRGSSAVGLTAYVTKDPETRENILESGALVLSDRGICCIDEFDKMGDAARSTLHEVMEQQTVSVAKAGIICQLNARTSVLAAANPRESRYNPRISIIDNLQLPPSLLSRFDLIYLLLDRPDEASDRKLARHLVSLHFETPEAPKTPIPMQQLTKYISYARRCVHPRLSDEAVQALTEEYVTMRKSGSSRKVITATPRQLESLIRMSESLARMRLSESVETIDVEEAVRLMKVAMQQAATDPRTGTIDMDLIQTGMSSSARKQREMIISAVKEILEELPVNSDSTMTVDKITAKLRERVPTTQRGEVLDALRLMAEEQYLELIGKETSVRKL